jgi:hypothetical protein
LFAPARSSAHAHTHKTEPATKYGSDGKAQGTRVGDTGVRAPYKYRCSSTLQEQDHYAEAESVFWCGIFRNGCERHREQERGGEIMVVFWRGRVIRIEGYKEGLDGFKYRREKGCGIRRILRKISLAKENIELEKGRREGKRGRD